MDPLDDWLASAQTRVGMLVRARLACPWGMRIDAHGKVMLHVAAAGTCWLRVARAEPRRLVQGDLVLLPHGDGHELADEPGTPALPLEQALTRAPPRPSAPSTSLVCGTYALDEAIARPLLRALPKVLLVPAARVRAHPGLSGALALLTSEIDRPAPGGALLLRHLFEALFVYLVRAWLEDTSDARASWLSALRDEAVARALSRLHSEPARGWTVEELARAAGLSRASFARRFVDSVGEPPLAYLARWRMGLAARLLAESDAPIAEVAKRVGYDSEFAFSRAFKRIRGTPPSAARR